MLNSPVDLAIIAAVALVVFGPKKLPELGKALGQGLGNFKKHLTDAQKEVKAAMDSEPEPTPAPAGAVASGDDPKNSTG